VHTSWWAVYLTACAWAWLVPQLTAKQRACPIPPVSVVTMSDSAAAAGTDPGDTVVAREESLAAGDKQLPYKCPGCNRRFADLLVLDTHSRIHPASAPFFCVFPGCNRQYSQRGSLKAHLKAHMGHKDHKCRFCERRFTQRASCLSHERVHTNERPFVCPEPSCNRSFVQQGNCERHLLIHTGERPFLCRIGDCTKSFSRLEGLRNHIQSRHRTHAPDALRALVSQPPT